MKRKLALSVIPEIAMITGVSGKPSFRLSNLPNSLPTKFSPAIITLEYHDEIALIVTCAFVS